MLNVDSHFVESGYQATVDLVDGRNVDEVGQLDCRGNWTVLGQRGPEPARPHRVMGPDMRFCGADDEIRTRDIHLGKESTLVQCSQGALWKRD